MRVIFNTGSTEILSYQTFVIIITTINHSSQLKSTGLLDVNPSDRAYLLFKIRVSSDYISFHISIAKPMHAEPVRIPVIMEGNREQTVLQFHA